MSELLISLAELCQLPLRGGFAELDAQINKLRLLRDSYQVTLPIEATRDQDSYLPRSHSIQ